MLTAIRTGLQARDDVLSGSLELIGREREIIRTELGHVQELIDLEERRVAAGAGQVPTGQVEPAVAAAAADPEPAATTPAESEFATMAQAEPEPAFEPAAEADSARTAQAEPDPAFSSTEEPTFVAAAQAGPDATFAPMPEPEVQFAPMAESESEPAFAPMAQSESEPEPAFAPMAESEAETEPLAPAARYAEMLRRIEVLRHLPVS